MDVSYLVSVLNYGNLLFIVVLYRARISSLLSEGLTVKSVALLLGQ